MNLTSLTSLKYDVRLSESQKSHNPLGYETETGSLIMATFRAIGRKLEVRDYRRFAKVLKYAGRLGFKCQSAWENSITDS